MPGHEMSGRAVWQISKSCDQPDDLTGKGVARSPLLAANLIQCILSPLFAPHKRVGVRGMKLFLIRNEALTLHFIQSPRMKTKVLRRRMGGSVPLSFNENERFFHGRHGKRICLRASNIEEKRICQRLPEPPKQASKLILEHRNEIPHPPPTIH